MTVQVARLGRDARETEEVVKVAAVDAFLLGFGEVEVGGCECGCGEVGGWEGGVCEGVVSEGFEGGW